MGARYTVTLRIYGHIQTKNNNKFYLPRPYVHKTSIVTVQVYRDDNHLINFI